MTNSLGGAALAAALLFAPGAALADAVKPLKIGKVTWHAAKFLDQPVTLVGYPLELLPATVYFSDEATGKIGPHDLAVTGPGLDAVQLGHKYVLVGTFKKADTAASNGSKLLLELSQVPAEVK